MDGSRHLDWEQSEKCIDSAARPASFSRPAARARTRCIAFRYDFRRILRPFRLRAQAKDGGRAVTRVIPSYFIIDESEDHSPRTTGRNLRPTAIKSSMKFCVRGHGWEWPAWERETLSRCFIVFIYNWDSFCERDTPTTGSDSTARRRAVPTARRGGTLW